MADLKAPDHPICNPPMAHLALLTSICFVDPIPYLFSSLDSSATSFKMGFVLSPAEAAFRHRSCSHTRASRLSLPWSFIENRTKCCRNCSGVIGSNGRLAAHANALYSLNKLRIFS